MTKRQCEILQAVIWFIVLILIMVQIPEVETYPMRIQLELPEREEPVVDVVYPPPQPYRTPMKNWWGTPDDPVIWPE